MPADGLGRGLGLDLSAVIQAALVELVLFAAAVAAVRRAASCYFVVDAAGFAAAYHDLVPEYAMPPQEQQQQAVAAAPEMLGPCVQCGAASTKKCSRCKRMRYCSGECQSKHWQSDHNFKCKQTKLLDTVEKSPFGVEANSKKSSVFGRISLVPGHRKLNKVIFPYDEFLKLYDWNDRNYDANLPCGLVNCSAVFLSAFPRFGEACFAEFVGAVDVF